MAKTFAHSTVARHTAISPALNTPIRRGRKPRIPATDALPSTSEVAAVHLSPRVTRLIDGIRPAFKSFVVATSEWLQTRAELAPSFMKAFTAYKEETGLTFVDFVRNLDPSIGVTRDEYRAAKSYQAADYLARLWRQQTRERVAPSTSPREKPATPLDGMVRLIASVLPLISASEVEKLWAVVSSELHWSERQVSTLQNRVKEADPLINVRPPRGSGGNVPQLRIAMPRSREDVDESSVPMHG